MFCKLLCYATTPFVISFFVYSYHSWSYTRPVVLRLSSAAEFDWETLEPSRKLEWVDCYTDYQCARFQVPLDYSDPDGELAVIALIRIPSPFITSSSSDYLGPVIFNPGGPGGDGVSSMLKRGPALSAIVGPRFDLVTFDPRGVGRTTPRMSLYGTEIDRALWKQWEWPNLNVSTSSIQLAWARAQIMGRLAEERDGGAAKHVATNTVARDMLQITQAYGQDRIRYWGFSYGTVLGATFAAMFPDHIERMILDGVVDAEDYFEMHWMTAMEDTDKALEVFFSECASAGADRCSFYAPTAQAVSQRLTALYASVRARPVVVHHPYGIVDYFMLRHVIFTSLYYPYALWPMLAKALSDLEAGNGTTLFELSGHEDFDCHCDGKSTPFYVNNFEAQTAILCSDAEEVHDSPQELHAYYGELLKVSNWAEILGSIRIRCSGWRIRTKDHFTGPFVADTSYPILLIGNTADPITPLSSAHKMSKGFSGSIVLTQDSPGHCSFSGPSLCTMKHIHQYFEDGTLPEPGTICSVDLPVFFNRSQALENNIVWNDYDFPEAAQYISKRPLIGICA